jgi:glycosyltransferase involved in cell wall biosynthesis
MKILLASSSSGSRGGGELYLLYLGRALKEAGHEVILWASDHERMNELCELFAPVGRVIREPYVNTYDFRLRSLRSYWNASAARRIAATWRGLAPDVVHVNKQNLEDGLDLLEAATLSKIPSLATIHLSQNARYLKASFAPLRDWVSRRALLKYRGPLVTVLEQRRTDLEDFLGKGESARLRTVPNGVPLYDLTNRDESHDAKRAELGVAHDSLLFLGVGRMVPQKRPRLFLETALRIAERLPHARFYWIGDGLLAEQWDLWVAERHLQGVIERVPWQRDVLPWLFAADAFLHTAEFEGLPLAVLEALSASLPVCLTPNLLSEMPFLTPEVAIPVGEGSPEWADILADPDLLRVKGIAARKLAEEQFSYGMMAKRYVDLYEGLVPR